RLHYSAPPPEGSRRSTLAGALSGTGSRVAGGGRAAKPGGRLFERRYGGVLVPTGKQALLVHGDEHAAASRTSGNGVHHWAGLGQATDTCRARRAPGGRASARHWPRD